MAVSETAAASTTLPLTVLTEDERIFAQSVRDFADAEIKPHVLAMDEEAAIRPEIVRQCFELGLMGVEVPEQYGGAGGSIFMATLAIEELARVDASAAIYVDVHNTLVNDGVCLRAGTWSGAGIVFANNALHSASGSPYAGSTGAALLAGNVTLGNLDAFVSVTLSGSERDAMPADGSPLIGAGSATWVTEHDLYGTVRAGTIDAGAVDKK